MSTSKVKPIEPAEASPELGDIYQGLEAKMGMIPNIFKNMGNSPAVLKAYLGLSGATQELSLSPALREKIALVVGEENNCDYCVAAHTVIAKGVGLSDEETVAARQGSDEDPKEAAIIQFAKSIVANKGWPEESSVAEIRAQGVSDQELVEIILVTCVNIFTNYFNHITEPEIDF